MLETIYVVTDLGPGDGGKGGVVHALARQTDASVIIKRGGAQGSHGVRTSQGESFNFSQWGCGTLEGVPTYCSPQMILSPAGLDSECNALKHHGIYDPYQLLTVDPSCICSTHYHMIASQLEELKLGKNPRGTVGTGVGRAYRMHKQLGDSMTVRAYELTDRETVKAKLEKQRDYYIQKFSVGYSYNGIKEDNERIYDNFDLLYDDNLIDFAVSLFEEVGSKLHFAKLDYVLQQYDGTAIVECSHGVLTDAETGLKPHVSAIRTLPHFTERMLRDAGFEGNIKHLAVHRAYEIRHGAGPMPTYDPEFTEQMLPGSHKDENRWQGIVRAGPLDINLLRRALSACKDTKFDGVCLTWFDQVLATSRNWRICTSYDKPKSVLQDDTDYYKNATPVVEDHFIPEHISVEELYNYINRIVIEYVDAPLRMLSIGPTETDKIMKF